MEREKIYTTLTMSDSRQRFTGKVFGKFLLFGIVFLVVWWLPLLLLRLFPDFIVTSKEPWLLNPQDLTWKRSVLNMAMKPGFRIIPSLLVMVIMFTGKMVMVMIKGETHRLKWQVLGERLNEMRLRQSMEWVIEGNRPSTFSEYAHWLGVLR